MSDEIETVTFHDMYTSKQKDQAILEVLEDVIKRPLFLGLYHLFFKNPKGVFQNLLMFNDRGNYEREVVGSSRDGLKCGRVFSCGDIDSLAYSPIILDESDEKTFEYREDYPAYFHFPQPDRFTGMQKVDGKYLDPNHIRQFHQAIFPTTRNDYRFTIIPERVETSDVKCAVTKTVPYKDSTYKPEFTPPPGCLDHKFCNAWQVDHAVLAYLLNLKNGDKLQFVRELVYGSADTLETTDILKEGMKKLVSHWKTDFLSVAFITYDLLHFEFDTTFHDKMKEAVDNEMFERYRCIPTKLPHGEYSADIVPAIRCKIWPRAADSFRNRKRKWPTPEVIDEIVNSGFQVVARGCIVSPESTKDFILSFSPSEAKLVDNLPLQAKTAYCLLKSCYKSALSKEDIGTRKTLKSYHLKTALFWVAEDTDPNEWKSLDILSAVRLVIDFLLKSLCEGNLPVLFVPESNLIGDYNEEDTRASVNILTAIHRNPANFIQVLIDTEWEYTKITMVDDGSFEALRKDGGPFFQLTWEEQIKLFAIAAARAGDCPVDDLMDKPGFFYTSEFQEGFIGNPFNTTPVGNIADIFDISDDQLDNVDVFVQTISQNEVDLFNVLDLDIDPEICHQEDNNIKEEMLELYFMFDKEADKKFGETFFNCSSKLRLKFYANVFHFISIKLLGACLQDGVVYMNKDAVYITRFLKMLIRKKNFNQENVEDLLHYLLFFCHFTRLRHHDLGMTDQILRSIREFLQDAKNLMTVYINPKLVVPTPLDLGNQLIEVLKECFPRKDQPSAVSGVNHQKNPCQPARVMDDLDLD